MEHKSKQEHILIIGAGLCGTMLAIRLAQRGYQVSLYESRGDMRTFQVDGGRSINLALSARGLMALDIIGLKEEVLKMCIPMHGRMIHNMDGSKRLSRYSGRQEDYINSVSRPGLNIALLNKAEEFEHLRMYFNAKCTQVDLNNSTAHFTTADGPFEVKADIIIGTDGAGSAVRGSFMKKTTQLLFNFSQDFLRSGYKELTIPPTEDGRHRIEKNALHIWPRGQFMMIALPNLDGSFTVTLFHPYEGEAGFNTLNGEEKLLSFFKKYYPDSLEHMPELWEDYKQNPVGVLGTIKCYPWQAFGKNLIMGDAAHAIVPFYGQGMNASFEDVRVFDEILDAHEGDWPAICYQFQEARYRNTNAIADLAIDNFYEMQDKVDDEDFIRKRQLEMKLEQTYDDYYSKYSLVTFRPEMPYEEAMVRGRKQDAFLLEKCRNASVEEMDLQEVYQEIKEIKY
jgi:kynurenine 3-monooxygenase